MLQVRPLSRDEVRQIDRNAAEALGLPGLALMENAGRGAALWLRDVCHVPLESGPGSEKRSRGLILCGPGNNGGDGGVVARHLDAWGVGAEALRVVWLTRPERLRGDAAVQFHILDRAGINQDWWDPDDPQIVTPERLDALLGASDWVIDALFGTGLTRPVAGAFRLAVEAINRWSARDSDRTSDSPTARRVYALDIPSGLDADTGWPPEGGIAVRATATATFVALKRGFDTPEVRGFTGPVTVVEIGVPRLLLEPFLS